ncbi:MAG: intermembrane transport protein PqiB [Halioglobus sp.]
MNSSEATITRGSRISGVWLIPLLALLMGAYVVLHAWWTRGPEIEIAFKTASGLERGQTRVKYRNVDMGVVSEVRLNESIDGVIAKVKLNRQAYPLLRDDTRFWVVTARIGLDSISGLDTILSGAYIQLAPGTGIEGQRRYVGLEQPPQTPTGAPGLRLELTSESASSISAGDIVLYKGFEVGRVESMELDLSDRQVRYVIFIDAPYHELINSSVRFWDVSGISVSVGADGVKVDTGSADTIFLGGVAFGLPEGVGEGDVVENNTSFKLYQDYDDILENPYRRGAHYVVSFNHSVKGLLPGAPVEYRGIPVGRVERIMLRESIQRAAKAESQDSATPIPVLIYLEPARLQLPDRKESLEQLHQILISGVNAGLRATLETGSLLTGAKYVGIDYYDNIDDAQMATLLGYPLLPSIDNGLGQLQQKATAVLDMLNALPLDETVSNANAAIDSLNGALKGLDTMLENQSTQNLPQQIEQTLGDLRKAVAGLSPDSQAYKSLNTSLSRLNRALANFETLSQTLVEQPNALILPTNPTPDPQPEAQ